METREKVTEKQLAALLWLKALDDFHEKPFEDSDFAEKYERFDKEYLPELTKEEFLDAVDFWIKKKVFSEDKVTGELSVTSKGKKLFKKLDSMDGMSDEQIHQTINNPADLEKIKNFAVEHYADILSTISLIVEIVSKL